MSNRITPTLAICLAGAAAAIAALGIPASPPAETPTTTGRAATATVEIVDFDFSGPLSVAPGETVDVANLDGAAHTLTAVDGTFDTGVVDGNGTSTFAAPSAEGSFDYFCAIHPTMTGRLDVSPA